MRIVIITGCDRSGTTFLANLLKHAPDIEARHEFFGASAALNPSQPGRTFNALSYYDPDHPYLERILRHEKDEVLARFPDRHAFVAPSNDDNSRGHGGDAKSSTGTAAKAKGPCELSSLLGATGAGRPSLQTF